MLRTLSRIPMWLGLLATLLSLSFESVSGQSPGNERKMLPKKWVGIWRVGGTANDTLFGWVREHVANDLGVYILDAGTLEVHAFDPRNSRHLWSVGTKGSGPGQLLRPVDIALTPRREIAVLDPGNGRISIFDSTGRFTRGIASPIATNGRSLCFLDDGTVLIAVADRDAAVTQVEPTGRERKRWKFPWPVKEGASDFLRSTVAIRGGSTDRCTFATTFGFGVFSINRQGQLITHPFIEQVAMPTFRQTTMRDGGVATFLDKGDNAAQGGSRSGDTTLVSFAGSKIRGGVIDLYLNDGRYIGSWPTPPEDRLFYMHGRLYGLSSDGATQRLRVWVDEADTAKALTEMGLRQPRRPTPTRVPRAGTTVRRLPPAPVPPPAHR